MSKDNLLRVTLVGDFIGYNSLPSFEDFYLVIPRQGGPGQPQDLGRNYSMWMLLERVRFTLDGVECNKIGVSYEAFKEQPNFCLSPFQSCLRNQLWNFKEADQNRIERRQIHLYSVEGRFERINQHPNAGTHSFSIGITEVLNTNLLIELASDDIEFVSKRSLGKTLNITIPTFEALTQVGVATITAKSTGQVEASYILTFDCSKGVSLMEEQSFIMKPNGVATQSFKLSPTTDQAAKYVCTAILKDSNFIEADRAECQFSTTATILDNGSQVPPFHPPKDGANGKNMDQLLGGFGRLHHGKNMQKGLFDPLYDWWEYHVWGDEHRARHSINNHHHHHNHHHSHHHHNVHVNKARHHKHKQRSTHEEHNHSGRETEYYQYLHHVHKDKNKHRSIKKQHVHSDGTEIRHHRHGRENQVYKDLLED